MDSDDERLMAMLRESIEREEARDRRNEDDNHGSDVDSAEAEQQDDEDSGISSPPSQATAAADRSVLASAQLIDVPAATTEDVEGQGVEAGLEEDAEDGAEADIDDEDVEEDFDEDDQPVEPTYEPIFAPGGEARQYLEGQQSAARIRLDIAGDTAEFSDTVAHGLAEEILAALWAPHAPAPDPGTAPAYNKSQRKAQNSVRWQMQHPDGIAKARATAMTVVDSARAIHEQGILRHRFNNPEAAEQAVKAIKRAAIRSAKGLPTKKPKRDPKTKNGYPADLRSTFLERMKKIVAALQNKLIAKDVLRNNSFANIDDLTLAPDEYLRRKLFNSKDNVGRVLHKKKSGKKEPSQSGEKQPGVEEPSVSSEQQTGEEAPSADGANLQSQERSSMNSFAPMNPQLQPGPDGSFFHLAVPDRDEEGPEPVAGSGSSKKRKRAAGGSKTKSAVSSSKKRRTEDPRQNSEKVDGRQPESHNTVSAGPLFEADELNMNTTSHVDSAFAHAVGAVRERPTFNGAGALTTMVGARAESQMPPRPQAFQQVQAHQEAQNIQQPQQPQQAQPEQQTPSNIQPTAVQQRQSSSHPQSFSRPDPVQQTQTMLQLRFQREMQELQELQQLRARQRSRELQQTMLLQRPEVSLERRKQLQEQLRLECETQAHQQVRYLQRFQTQAQRQFDHDMRPPQQIDLTRETETPQPVQPSQVMQASQIVQAPGAQEQDPIEIASGDSSESSGLFVAEEEQLVADTEIYTETGSGNAEVANQDSGVTAGGENGTGFQDTEAQTSSTGLEAPGNNNAAAGLHSDQAEPGVNPQDQDDNSAWQMEGEELDLSNLPDFGYGDYDLFAPLPEGFDDIFSNMRAPGDEQE